MANLSDHVSSPTVSMSMEVYGTAANAGTQSSTSVKRARPSGDDQIEAYSSQRSLTTSSTPSSNVMHAVADQMSDLENVDRAVVRLRNSEKGVLVGSEYSNANVL